MTDRTRIKVAAALTALFLIAIAVLGIATHSDGPSASAAASPSAALEQGSEAAPAAQSSEAGYLETAQQLIEDVRGLVGGEEGDDD